MFHPKEKKYPAAPPTSAAVDRRSALFPNYNAPSSQLAFFGLPSPAPADFPLAIRAICNFAFCILTAPSPLRNTSWDHVLRGT
jgi:hypothetical protein